MIVAAVAETRRGAIFELEKSGVGAFGWSIWIPHADRGSHAAHESAPDQPSNVEVVRSLAEDDATALTRVQLRGQARPVQPVIEVPAVDHPQPSQTPAAHDLADGLDRRFVALRLADDHLDSSVLDRLDHPVGVRERDRERLFDNDVFRRACRRQDVLGVQVRRRRDIHRVNVRVRTQRLDAGVAAHRILLSESLDQIGARVRRGEERGVRMTQNRRQRRYGRAAQAHEPEPHRLVCHRSEG
jgi:hypothetical protein